MNAVKNCLAVLAAAVVLASCSADPTSSLAGNATLTVTPGAISIRAGQTAEVFATALDALGGAVDGHFTVTPAQTDTSIYTVAIDTAYNTVYAGDRPTTRTRVVVRAKKEINSSFTISGTGGSVTIPLRIGPDSLNFNVTFTSTAVGLGNLDTATAPAGIRFTSATTVSFSGSDGSFAPAVTGFSADSTQIYFLPPINAHGKVNFTKIVNTVTPTITYSAFSRDTVLAPIVDSFPGGHSAASLAANQVDTITITNPEWRFTSASTLPGYGTNGIILGLSADSTQMYVLPTPGAADSTGPLLVTNLVYSKYPGQVVQQLPTAGSTKVLQLASIGQDGPTGTIPTIQLPALGNYGFWDLGTFDSTDYSPDGGFSAQYYRYNLGVAAHVNTNVQWNVGNDVDIILLADDGTYSTPVDGFSGASAKTEETSKSGALTAGTYLLDVINYGPFDAGGTSSVGARLRFLLTVF